MNPFQHARNEALRIREQLCLDRKDEPLSAIEILERVEEVLNVGVFPVASTYPELGGGSAVLKRNQSSIYISTEFNEWGDKFCGLLAHELGHWYLDPTETDKTIANLKSIFGSEGSPAVVKVEAYGARERQELQANVFARELLLPRHVARRIALTGKGPIAVAPELGIPLEFVRQQMLDALLLPEGSTSEGILKTASPDQKKAARASEQFANVVAGPGTGKTSTLIHRIKYLIEEKGIHPSQLLVLTFTNKAAFELIERLRSGGIQNAAEIWAGTFHGFGLEFLRKYHQLFGLENDINVADKMASVSMLISTLPQLQLNYYFRIQDPYEWLGPVVTAIMRLKEELVSPEAFSDFIKTYSIEDEEVRRRLNDVSILYQAHEESLKNKKTVDFVDLIAKPALAIANDRVPFSELVDRFQYILVDEYQDVTQAMVLLLRQLAYKRSLWVVGDIRQAIHHWRGASLKSLLKFDSEFKAQAGEGKIGKYPLEYNRRSTPEILDLVQEVGRRHELQADLPLDPLKPTKVSNGIKPYLINCAQQKDIPLAIERGIQKCVDVGVEYGKQAVLCRTGKEMRQVSEYFMSQGIPTLYIGELAERSEIKILLCLMQLLVERQPRALIGLINIPYLAMPMQDIHLLIDAVNGNQLYQRGRWINKSPVVLSEKGEQVRQSLKELIGDWNHRSNPWHFICHLLLEHRLCLPKDEDQSVAAWVHRIALWQFVHTVRNGEGDMKEARLSRFLLRQRLRQRIGDAYVDRGLPPEASSLNGVRLETVHGSKGLEFDAVHVGFINASSYSGKFPNWQPPDNVLDIIPPEVLGSNLNEYHSEEAVERNNLLYVAVSRARERLFLYQDTKFGKDSLAPQLLYCQELVQRFSFEDQEQEKKTGTTGQGFQAPDILTFDHFHTYSTCALQYWYANCLNLSKEHDIDVSMRARWSIMGALKTVARDEVLAQSALSIEWCKSNLPTSIEDPSLWEDANYAYERGIKLINKIQAIGGIFAEPTSIVAGLRIQLPWGFLISTKYSTKFCLLRFNRRGFTDIKTLLKPIILGMEVQGTPTVELHYVMSDLVDNAPTPRQVEQTKGFESAVKFLGGNIAPIKGSHCSRCAYATLCPSIPS